MARRREPTTQERDAFQREFGIEPSDSSRLRGLELRIINNEIEDDQHQLRVLGRRLREIPKATDGTTQSTLKSLHHSRRSIADQAGRILARLNRRIKLARRFGFQPRVFRRGGGR